MTAEHNWFIDTWPSRPLTERVMQTRSQLQRRFVAELNPHFYDDVFTSEQQADIKGDYSSILEDLKAIETEFKRLQNEGRTPPPETFEAKVQSIAALPTGKAAFKAFTGYVRESFPHKDSQ